MLFFLGQYFGALSGLWSGTDGTGTMLPFFSLWSKTLAWCLSLGVGTCTDSVTDYDDLVETKPLPSPGSVS